MRIKMPLWLYFLSVVAVSLVISTMLYFFVFLDDIKEPYILEAKNQNKEITESSKLYLESKLEEQYNIIMGVEIAHHNIVNPDDLFLEEYYTEIIAVNEYINVIEVIGSDNVVMYSSLDNQNRVGLDLTNYYLIEEINGVHGLAIGHMNYGILDNELHLEIAYSGENYTILSYISVSYFESFGEEMKESFEDKEFMIIEDNGKLLYDSKNSLHEIRYRTESFEDIVDLYNNDDYLITLDGVESVASVSRFSNPQWYVVSYEDLDSALSLQSNSIEYLTLTISIIIGIFVLLYVVSDYSVIREFRLLGNKLESLSNDEKSQYDIKPSVFNEVNSIREKFNAISSDLLEKKEELRFLAYNDSLTRLPSKNKAMIDFNEIIANCPEVVFVYVDLKRFGVINDNFGFDFGDEILKIASKRMVNKFDYFYRIDGDEFLIISHCKSGKSVEEIVMKIQSTFKNPIVKNGITLKVSYNIGVSHYPNDSKGFEDLLAHAVVANHQAKKSSSESYVIFDNSKQSYYKRLSKIEILLQKAFENEEFITIYQPIVNIDSKEIRGFEALSRWNNTEIGDIFPDEFIPILEKTHLISILDQYVLNNSIKMIKFLNERYNKKFIISVNLSVETIMLDGFTDIIDEFLEKYDLNPKLLELEITESTIIRDFEGITKKMQYLINKGVKFSEDDFGDGYSSLTYLTRLNLDTLKISRNFLTNIINNVESRYLVQTIITLSKKLGFKTIVEGVEDEETFQLFKEYKCDFVQGYLLYRPQTENILINTLDKLYMKGEN